MSPYVDPPMSGLLPSLEAKYRDDGQLSYLRSPRPSDFHNHFRLGALRQAITPEVSWPYRYMLSMPNTNPHIYTVEEAEKYRQEVLGILEQSNITDTELVMTIYLAGGTTIDLIEQIARHDQPIGVKSYPPGGTTNSDEAVPLLHKLYELQAMEELGVRLLIHGESTHDLDGNPIDFPDREDYFYREVYPRVREKVPDLPICLEHITTSRAVETVREDKSGNTVCTITPQHGLLTDQAFNEAWGGVHARCMPYLKGPADQRAVQNFMVSGDRRAILGTDCAPHLSAAKNKPFAEAACGCFTPHALSLYINAFAKHNALDDRFVRFACTNGPDWWELPWPSHKETVLWVEADGDGIPNPTPVPEENDVVIPLGWTDDPEERLQLRVVYSQ